MKPNVIMIVSDQHRFCDMGCAGNEDVYTPNMDRMEQDGAIFENTYSSCPLCVPARGSLFTGVHALKHGAAANDMPVKTDIESVADVFKRAGYMTGHIGKWHLGGVPRDKFIPENERLGFEFWNGCNCNHSYMNAYYDDNENVRHLIEGYEPEAQTRLALLFLETQGKGNRPFFLSLCFGTPHDPYREMPEEYLKKYDEKHLKMRANYCEENVEQTGAMVGDIQQALAGYYAHIEQIDRQIGKILDWVKENGIEENTIVVYTSDHGDMLKSHGMGQKQYPYEESAKIPFIIRWNGRIPHGRRKQLLSIIDIAPTLAGLCGLRFDSAIDGIDCSKACMEKTAPTQDSIYMYSLVPCHIAFYQKIKTWRAISTGDYMFGTDGEGNPVWLYDLKRDPYQMNNLLNEKNQPLVSELRAILDRYVEENDGYEDYEFLLDDAGILDKWFDSEIHFGKIWGGEETEKAKKEIINHSIEWINKRRKEQGRDKFVYPLFLNESR